MLNTASSIQHGSQANGLGSPTPIHFQSARGNLLPDTVAPNPRTTGYVRFDSLNPRYYSRNLLIQNTQRLFGQCLSQSNFAVRLLLSIQVLLAGYIEPPVYYQELDNQYTRYCMISGTIYSNMAILNFGVCGLKWYTSLIQRILI